MNWAVRLFFWPWFWAESTLYETEARELTDFSGFFVGSMLIVVLLMLLCLWLKKKNAPFYVGTAVRFLFIFFAFGFLGGLSNGIATYAGEKGKMPTWSEYGSEDYKHYIAEGDDRILWLSNWIDADYSPTLQFLFPHYRHVSLGDLAIAACIIFTWWTPIFLAATLISRSCKRAVIKR